MRFLRASKMLRRKRTGLYSKETFLNENLEKLFCGEGVLLAAL